jgi:hypothetical protein
MPAEWRLPEEHADELLAAWYAEAARRGLCDAQQSTWWTAAADWIAAKIGAPVTHDG